MADRILRERDRALPARLASLETKVRTLGLRTWQGAVRTAQYLDGFTPATPTQYNVMVSLTVPAGRWIVLATASAAPVAVLANDEQIIFSLFAYDAETNDILPDASFDNPSGYMWCPTGAAPIQSVTLVNDVTYDADVLVVFACADVNGAAFNVYEPRLRMLPV